MRHTAKIVWIGLGVMSLLAAVDIADVVSGWIGVERHLATSILTVLGASITGLGAVSFLLAKEAPPQMIPSHMGPALDALHEGILILDTAGRIVLANQTFLNLCGQPRGELLGQRARDLSWTWRDDDPEDPQAPDVPWLDVVREARPRQGQLLGLPGDHPRRFVLTAVPIADEGRPPCGALVSFEDVSKLQKTRAELSSVLETVRQSAMQIRKQNAELEQLAIRDALTGCFNRRSCFEFLEKFWSEARRYRDQLSCIMADVDQLRTINEQRGNAAADDVLRKVAVCLQQSARECDIICRYNSDEFVVLMPRTSLADAALVAERLRQAISRLHFPDFSVSASLGISSLSEGPQSPQQLLDQAEHCLKLAKKHGRNQVVRHDALEKTRPQESQSMQILQKGSSIIPFPAVTALMSALSYRDVATASHSRRVADLCVTVGQSVMSMSNCYVLEMAALLHDIGKIGVPDSILLKHTSLTDEEWEVMRAHERIGLEIVRTAFGSRELSEIVERYSERYEDSAHAATALPLGARILAIADAYDSMVTDHLYRPAMSPAEAVAELRRCSGTQFDPDIVEQFVEVLYSRGREVSLRVEVARDTALALGLEIESLAEAVDHQDLETLKTLAGRLSATASRNGAPEIAVKALELEQAAAQGDDLLGILNSASELLSHCRATQSNYLGTGSVTSRRVLPVLSLSLS